MKFLFQYLLLGLKSAIDMVCSMKRPGNLKDVIPLCFAVLLFAGSCVSMVEKAGKTLDGSAADEMRVAVYRTEQKKGAAAGMELWEVQNKAGLRSVIIFLNEYPSIKLRGSFPNESGEFYLTSLEYIAGNYHGWNEYRMDLFGAGSLVITGNTAVLAVSGKIETVQISSGRIQQYDTRLTGNEALARLRDRQERISALTEWMKQLENAPKGLAQDAFESYWKPVFFPELVSKKKQPTGWKQEGDQWIWADSIRWNKSYTERVFPQLLREIRNTGTILRDWEEALPWIYIDYEWETILGLLAQEITLQKKK